MPNNTAFEQSDTVMPHTPSSVTPSSAVPESVTIVEVSPRDGLQNEATLLPTETKLELIDHLVASGLRRIEATSFVHPKRVPQMADAEAVSAALPRGEVSWIGLVLNERGLDRAIAAGLDEVNIVVVASDTFSRRNQGTSTDEGVDLWNRLAKRASDAGLKTTVTIAAAFGCPFEGEVPTERVADLIRRCSDAQPDEIALADTIGVGVPAQVVALADAARREAPGIPLRWHFHNTRNTGYANALTALQLGASALDASLGGIGGCPFAPAATGNIATEDLWYLLDRSGCATGVDPAVLLSGARRLGEMLGTTVPGQLSRAGLFPPVELPPA
ncbi:3-hydroxy-3-methylglutarate-CoA lyase [Gordonia alkanivorans CGMCC 6845]|uniref:3-hydroxy-3-methylglutarate-CoA lyase n=2 Tax=Gordoniaceae TaxID=85026 RepID=W9D9M5_9ACTN|nr:3-hydroxy-3-methylglutarate-CoA lyase [Gordonia alkanivorans CGMCC 6845]